MENFEAFEEEFLPDYKAAREYAQKGAYEKAAAAMSLALKKTEAFLGTGKGALFSFNHILEVYYFRFFHPAGQQDISYAPFNVGAFYRFYGYLLMRLEKYHKAIAAYRTALDWNPVDLDSLLQLSELYKKTKDLKHTKETTLEAYNYCCSRATLAHFYRNLGFYYLESYQPELATALYLYSNIFFSSEAASRDLTYLEAALKRPTPELSLPQLQAALKENNIPVGPNPDTVGITFRTGQLELERQHYEAARDCFTLVYELTYDKEARAYLEQLLE